MLISTLNYLQWDLIPLHLYTLSMFYWLIRQNSTQFVCILWKSDSFTPHGHISTLFFKINGCIIINVGSDSYIGNREIRIGAYETGQSYRKVMTQSHGSGANCVTEHISLIARLPLKGFVCIFKDVAGDAAV